MAPKTPAGEEPGSQGAPGKAPWAPTGRGLPQDKDSAFTNDPNSPGYPGSIYDNLSGQRGAAEAGPAETSDQAQAQVQTRRRGGGRARKKGSWTGGPWWTGMDAAFESWDSGPGYWNAQGNLDANKGVGMDPIATMRAAAVQMAQAIIDEMQQLADARNDIGAYQERLDSLEPGHARDAMRNERDAAADILRRKDPQALKDFEDNRLSKWQEGASEASYAWANFVDNAEPDRLKAIGDAIHENIAKPTEIAADALKDLAMGFAETAVAAFYEAKGLDAWKRATNEMLKQISRQAAAKALFEGAAALGSLAIGDIPGAALHGKAAAAYAATAAITGVGAALTGGLRNADTAEKKTADKGGPAPRTRDDARTQAVYQNTYYISYSGLSNDADVRRMLVDVLNGGVGSGERIDSRMVELR